MKHLLVGSSSKSARGTGERRGVGEAAESGPGRPQSSRDTRRHRNHHTKPLGRVRVDQSCPRPNVSQIIFFELSGVFEGYEIRESSLITTSLQ